MAGYEFYTETYLGNRISKEDFPRLAARAGEKQAEYERRYTVIYPVNASRDKALCALAEELLATERATETGEGAGVLTSAKVGSVSEGYDRMPAAIIAETASKRYLAALRKYADVYRGARR